MPGEDKYVCTLDAETIKKAKDELNEIPEDRSAAVQALREWVESQPHITFNTSTAWLLRYLRGAKFSQLRARKMIEGTLGMQVTFPGWMCDIDSRSPKVKKMLDEGAFMLLPGRDDHGRTVMLQRIGQQNAHDKSITFKEMVHTWMVLAEYMMKDETTQVNGIVFVADMTGMSLKHITRFDHSTMNKWHKQWQGNMPGRYKAFHYYNCGAFIDILMTVIKPMMPKKWMQRIKFHDNLESLYKDVPMRMLPEEYLPDDYKGEKAGTFQDLVGNLNSALTSDEHRNHVLRMTNSKYKIDESKRPKDDGAPNELFRKLNVD